MLIFFQSFSHSFIKISSKPSVLFNLQFIINNNLFIKYIHKSMLTKLLTFSKHSFQAELLNLRIITLTKCLLMKINSYKSKYTQTQISNLCVEASDFEEETGNTFQNSIQQNSYLDNSHRISWKSGLQLNCLQFYENYCCFLKKLDIVLEEIFSKKNIQILKQYELQLENLFKFIQKITNLNIENFKEMSNFVPELTNIYNTLKNKPLPHILFHKQFRNKILYLIVLLTRTSKSSRFFNQIKYKPIWKDPHSFTSIKELSYINQKLCKNDLSNLIKKYLNKREKELQICLSCERMIAFNKMDKHLKSCKDKYDLEQLSQKLDAEIYAKLQDVNSYIAKIKKLINQRQKQLEKERQKKNNPKESIKKSRELFFKKKYNTHVENRSYINQFQEDDERANSESEQQSRNSYRRPLRKLNDLNNDELNEYLKLVQQIKNTGNKIKNLKQSKRNELFQSLKSIKESTKPNIQKLAVNSEQIAHILNLFNSRMDILLKQRKHQLKIKKQGGLDHQNWINFTNNTYQTFSHQKKLIKKQKQKGKSKRESQEYFSDQEYSPRSCCIVEKNDMGLRDFKILKILGKGKYGEVFLVKKRTTGIKYALKKIFVENSKNYTQLSNLKIQHNIFQILNSPFLVKALYSFSQGDFHYFVMQYMPNGDFAQLLEREERLYEYQAKLCLAELVLAIKHLHDCQIIHKDLKPQNIVIDKNGHLKITDFGLSESGLLKRKLQEQKNKKLSNFIINELKKKQKSDKEQKKIVGSPYFMAPEVFNGQQITEMADWWSFGIIVYQTLVGIPPFTGKNLKQIKQNIYKNQKWPNQIKFGNEDPQSMISYEAKDLIDQLLMINPKHRLGRQFEDIKYHNFFEGVNWDNLENEKSQILDLLDEQKQIQEQSEEGYATDQQKQKEFSLTSANQSIKFYRRDILCSQTLAQHLKTEAKYKALRKFSQQLINKILMFA